MRTTLLSVVFAVGSIAAIPATARDLQGGSQAPAKRIGIEETFDRNKGSMYALYVRALGDRPQLSGKVVFEFDIAATGGTTACRVKSSELKAPELERQLCERILQFRFPPQAPVTITKPIDFFPAR